MARGRVRGKLCGLSTMSSTSLMCGSALLCFTVFSVICGRLLDVGDLHERAGRPPFPFPERSRSFTGENSVDEELQDLEDIPIEGDRSIRNVWTSKNAEQFYGCSAPSSNYSFGSSGVNGYIMIEASGGLNQQRTGITDSVVVARILNATLVLPELDHTSYWQDNSDFRDIFNVQRFISVVAPDVRVIEELPAHLRNDVKGMRVPRQSTTTYYEEKVLPKLRNKQVLKLTKFDFRLANKLDDDLQKLRCRVNYKALDFTQPIQRMGQILVDRMRRKGGRYIALHLRFEPDMLAFSGCYYGGGLAEIGELGEIRKRWKNLPILNPEKARRNGKCPLSPLEIGLLLRASGFGADTHLYVASGEVYGGERTLAPLKALFPNFYSKESLTTSDELQPFQAFSSRMAAIDYIVCDESDVFVANNNGNMARILAGHRRFSGHKRTIRPNASKLSTIFQTRDELGWEKFAERIRHVQKGFMGDPYDGKPGKGGFHENPAACICKTRNSDIIEHAEPKLGSSGKQQRKSGVRESSLLGIRSSDVDEDSYADSDGVRLDSEEKVEIKYMEDEVLEAGKEDAKLEGRVEEIDAAEENPLLTE